MNLLHKMTPRRSRNPPKVRLFQKFQFILCPRLRCAEQFSNNGCCALLQRRQQLLRPWLPPGAAGAPRCCGCAEEAAGGSAKVQRAWVRARIAADSCAQQPTVTTWSPSAQATESAEQQMTSKSKCPAARGRAGKEARKGVKCHLVRRGGVGHDRPATSGLAPPLFLALLFASSGLALGGARRGERRRCGRSRCCSGTGWPLSCSPAAPRLGCA